MTRLLNGTAQPHDLDRGSVSRPDDDSFLQPFKRMMSLFIRHNFINANEILLAISQFSFSPHSDLHVWIK